MVQPGRARTRMAAGTVRLWYVGTSGPRPHIDPTRKGLRLGFEPLKEHAASVTPAEMETAASSHKARTTICTPAKTETSIARTPAGVGRSMRTVVGRILVPSRLRMPRMQANDK